MEQSVSLSFNTAVQMTDWFRTTSTQNQAKSFFILILLLTLFERVGLLLAFHFNVTDIDQLVFWRATEDYAKGIFHEPYFYGQAYNPMLEALFAVPLIWLNVPESTALPLVTFFLSLLPFVLFSWFFAKQGNWLSAAIMMAWPALMNENYSIVANLPRGQIGGIAIASTLVLILDKPTRKWAIVFSGFVVPLSVWVCPNSLLLLVVIVPMIWINNARNKWFYIANVIGFTTLFGLTRAAETFYNYHSGHVVYESFNEYKPVWIWSAIQEGELWRSLNGLLPFSKQFGIALIPLLLITSILNVKPKAARAGLIILVSIIIVLSFGHSRVYAGNDNLFYSTIRFWLAVPLIMAIALAWWAEKLNAPNGYFIILLVVMIIQVSAKTSQRKEVVEVEATGVIGQEVAHLPIYRIKDHCQWLDSIAQLHKVDLVIHFGGQNEIENAPALLNYGCTSLIQNTTPSIAESGDRLSWNLKKFGTRPNLTIMLHGGVDAAWLPSGTDFDVIKDEATVIIVHGYQRTAFDLLNDMGMDRESERRNLLLSEIEHANP